VSRLSACCVSGFIAISLFMFEDEINAIKVSNSVEKVGYWPVYVAGFRSLYKRRN